LQLINNRPQKGTRAQEPPFVFVLVDLFDFIDHAARPVRLHSLLPTSIMFAFENLHRVGLATSFAPKQPLTASGLPRSFNTA
jgi:hypothetical protein